MNGNRNRISELFETILRYTVLSLMGLFTLYLTLLSLFGTNCNIAGKNFFLSDTPFKTLIAYVLLVALFIAIGRIMRRETHPALKVSGLFRPVLLAVLTVFLLVIVNALQLSPHGDQLAIANAAREARHYDFTQFMKGNYFDFWPFQSRIVVFLMAVWSLAGDCNYQAFDLLNVASIVVIIVMTMKVFAKTGLINEERHKNAILIALILFWPLLFYVTFVYGNLPGLAAMMTAFWFLADHLETHSVKSIIWMAVFCGIGLWLKNAYMILMIAMLVILLADLIRTGKVRSLAAIAAVLVCSFAVGSLSDAWLSHYMNMPVPEGSPMISWVTMAFGEDENGNPVKYDAYNITAYMENDLDPEKASAAALTELRGRLGTLNDTPIRFLSFMAKKTSLVWNEPTFDSLVFLNKGSSHGDAPKWLQDAIREDNRNTLYRFANIFHGLVLLGVLTWIVLKGRKAPIAHLLYGVTFIGGFLFELFWETQSQYALAYFLLLIPYGVMGYVAAAEYLTAKPPVKKAAVGFGVPLVLILIVTFLPSDTMDALVRLHADDERYTWLRTQQDLDEAVFTGALTDGFYSMHPSSDPTLGIAVSADYNKDDEINRQAQVLLSSDGNMRAGEISVVHEGDHDLIRIMRTQCLLSVDRDPNEPGAIVSQAYDTALWHIIPMEDGKYAVLCGENMALTAGGTDVTLSPYTGADSQLWLFDKR